MSESPTTSQRDKQSSHSGACIKLPLKPNTPVLIAFKKIPEQTRSQSRIIELFVRDVRAHSSGASCMTPHIHREETGFEVVRYHNQ